MRKCSNCGNDISHRRATAIYCSDSCKSRAHRSGPSMYRPPEGTAVRDPYRPSIGPEARFIIEGLERERDRLDSELAEARKERREFERQAIGLREELVHLKTDHKLEVMESSRPRGLGGVMESDGLKELLKLLGPVIASMKATQSAGSVGGQGNGNTYVEGFARWFPTLPDDLQQLWFDNVITPTSMRDHGEQKIILEQFKNTMENGKIGNIE